MSAVPFPRRSAAALTADPPPAPGNRKQILLAVCLLALAIGGGLGLAARNHWLKSNHKQDAPVPSVAGGTTAPPAAEKSSKRQPKSPIQPQPGPSPAGNPRQNPTPGPNPQAADATPRIFGIVGDIQLLGPIRRLTPSEVAMQHTTIRQERKAACVNLATGETVAYVSKPDLSDHVIVDAIVKTYPRVKDHMKAHEVQRKEMTQEIKDACGGDYDAIVILAVQAPPQNDAPTSVPHPADTHDHPASQFKHPHPQSEQEER
jgi:hypothetical protein